MTKKTPMISVNHPSRPASDNRPLVSLCMIVKNEEENLGLCLDDASQVADEIIVVDTGSTDNTKAIATASGAKVYNFEWIDDFAAARNASLGHARGQYILWLDADDRIEPAAIAKFKQFKMDLAQTTPKAYALKVVCQGMFGERAVFYQVRLFPNNAGMRFAGTVHESPAQSIAQAGLDIKQADIEIVHTGYDDYDAASEKVRRNLKILQAGPLDGQNMADHNFRLAQCYVGLRDYQNCLEHLIKARTAGPERPFYKESYAMLADCYRQTDQRDMAISILRQGVAEFPQSGQLYHLLGAALTLDGAFANALFYLEQSRKLTIEVGSSPVPTDIDGRRCYFQARCLAGLGRLDEACALFQKALKTVKGDPDMLRAYALLRLKMGEINEADTYLAEARAVSHGIDRRTWLASARLDVFLNRPKQALNLYLAMVDDFNNDVDGLVGIVSVSIVLADVIHLGLALEKLAGLVNLGNDIEISSTAALAKFIAEIGAGLETAGDYENRTILKNIAQRTDFDIFFQQCNQPGTQPVQAAAPQ